MVIGVTLGTSVNLTDFDRDDRGNYRIDDMILSEDHLRLLFGDEQELERQGVYLKDKKYVNTCHFSKFFGYNLFSPHFRTNRWPNGVIPYKLHKSFDEEKRNNIEKIFNEFNTLMEGCVKVMYVILIK